MMEGKQDGLSIKMSKDEKMNATDREIFELGLIKQERIGDILFFIGTLLAFTAADQAEAAVLQTQQETKKSLGDDALKTLTIESWIFLAASIFFANTAALRLKELEAGSESIPDKELLCGSKIATSGSFIKAFGFALNAVGNQIVYNSTQKYPFTG